MKRYFLLLILIPVVNLFSGTTGKITGRVIDQSTGEVLPFANIIVEGTTLGAAADANGYYFILNVPPGNYAVTASMIGYGSVRVEGIRVSFDFTTTQDFELSSTIIEKGELVVVAERVIIRPDLTSSLSVIGASDIETMPVQSFEDVLGLQAGVVHGHIRGGRSGEVAFLIDGISITSAYSGGIAVSSAYSGGISVEVENDAIQELQVVTGTFNAEYGQAMSGIVNIVTKEGSKDYSGEVKTWVGDYLTPDEIFTGFDNKNLLQNKNLQATLSGPLPFFKKKLTFFFTGRYFYSDGWLYGKREFTPQGFPGDNEIVPMNSYKKLFLHSKLSFQIKDNIKLNYSYFTDRIKYKNYDHFFKYNPDGILNRFESGYNHQIKFTHMLSSRTFYTINAARFYSDYQHYLYEDPLDSRYVHPDSLSSSAYAFADGGTSMSHVKLLSYTTTVKFDISSQITNSNEIKAGIESRFYDTSFEGFDIIPKVGEIGEIVPFEPDIPDITSPIHNKFDSKKPYEFSCYIQDKIEFKDMIVNIGLRFDYFEPDGNVLTDPSDPNILDPWSSEHQEMTLEERKEIWWKKATPKTQISPRFGVAYPITDRGVIHFSYGYFLQIPTFEYLYTNPEFEIPKMSGINTILGNADLDAQRTVMYEIGLQQAFTDNIAVDVTLFYRDIRDWVGTSPQINTVVPGTAYVKYINKDYANVRGITVAFDRYRTDKFGLSLDYTYQIVEGTSSNPEDAFWDARAGRAPRIQVIPLDWDQTHTVNLSILYGNAGLILRYGTGFPYTPYIVQGTRVGRSLTTGLKENSARKPSTLTADFNYTHDIKIRKATASFTIRILNLFDARNEEWVFEDTGRATYTLQERIAGADASPDWFIRPDFYSEPRQLQIGVAVKF
ncbi:TonB-dependent receptor [candidate division WOR-3 bacterium]|nr:TonB-dependent receptor [candidate division WOR-3 bacterium]